MTGRNKPSLEHAIERLNDRKEGINFHLMKLNGESKHATTQRRELAEKRRRNAEKGEADAT